MQLNNQHGNELLSRIKLRCLEALVWDECIKSFHFIVPAKPVHALAAVFTVLAGLFHHQCCMEFAAGQHRQSGRSFHAALMVQQACQHRSYISQCMGRLGSAYSMKRFDAASPHQGFKLYALNRSRPC